MKKTKQPEYNIRSRQRDVPIGSLTLRRIATLTHAQRDRIAQWLRDQAAFVEQDGENFAARFIARYHKG